MQQATVAVLATLFAIDAPEAKFDFLRDDVAETFERLTGYAPRDLGFYLMYAALRHAVIMARIQRRAIHFGEAVMPDDPDDLITFRLLVEEMLATG